jgi:leucyl aminopeptidase (aminopeptidase T)
MDAVTATKNALSNVLRAVEGESLVIVCDSELIEVGKAFAQGAVELGMMVRLAVQRPEGMRHEVPSHLRELIVSHNPDIFINCFRKNIEETPFRVGAAKLETRKKARLGHCPGITMDMLTEGAMAMTDRDYAELQGFADRMLFRLQEAERIRLTSDAGCNLELSVRERPFFTDTKVDWKTMKWMNLPVGEVLVAPVENSLNGTLVCDAAIGGVGLLETPVTIEAKDGRLKSIECGDPAVVERARKSLDADEMASVVGEFAFGINRHARKGHVFLETEKMEGTCHIAFGNNTDFPAGRNNSKSHMDFMMWEPKVEVEWGDGRREVVLEGREYGV